MSRLGYEFSPRSTELMVYGQVDCCASAVSAGLTTAPDSIGSLVLCTIMPWPSVSLEMALFSVSRSLLLSEHWDSNGPCESASRTIRATRMCGSISPTYSSDWGFSVVRSSSAPIIVLTIAWKMRLCVMEISSSVACVNWFAAIVVSTGSAALYATRIWNYLNMILLFVTMVMVCLSQNKA